MKIFNLFLLSLLVIGCAKVESPLEKQFRTDDSVVFKDSFLLRDKTIPLPPGDWRIAGKGFDVDKFFYISLIQEHKGNIFSYVVIQVDTLELNRDGCYIKSEVLEKEGMHHIVKIKNVAGEGTDGWYVDNRIVTITLGEEKMDYVKEFANYIKSHKLVISNRSEERRAGKE